MADAIPVKKSKMITKPNGCESDHHTFVVSKWVTTGGYQKSTHMMCQHCLLPIELNEASKTWVVNREWLKEAN